MKIIYSVENDDHNIRIEGSEIDLVSFQQFIQAAISGPKSSGKHWQVEPKLSISIFVLEACTHPADIRCSKCVPQGKLP